MHLVVSIPFPRDCRRVQPVLVLANYRFRNRTVVAHDRASTPYCEESVVGTAAPGRRSTPDREAGVGIGASPDRELAAGESISAPDSETAPVWSAAAPHREGVIYEVDVLRRRVIRDHRRPRVPGADIGTLQGCLDIQIARPYREDIVLIVVGDARRRIGVSTVLWERLRSRLHECGLDLVWRQSGILLQHQRGRTANHRSRHAGAA